MLSYQFDQIENIIGDIQSVTVGGRKNDRQALASVFEAVLVVDPYFPPRPLSMRRHDAKTLRKKTCSYCPSKIKPAQMKVYVEEAKSKLREYGATLESFLKKNPIAKETTSEPTDVHELKSNI